MELSESLEDYLIAIADLAEREQHVHSAQVADIVGVSTASVTNAFRALRDRGLIEYERYQAVELTSRGREVAADVIRRKETLTRFFAEVLRLDDDEARQNAHRMEHVITPAAIDRLEELVAEWTSPRHDGSG